MDGSCSRAAPEHVAEREEQGTHSDQPKKEAQQTASTQSDFGFPHVLVLFHELFRSTLHGSPILFRILPDFLQCPGQSRDDIQGQRENDGGILLYPYFRQRLQISKLN